MGDRANWGFFTEPGKPIINLYTHCHGSERYELLANALDYARPRWSDPSYATRIVISQIIGDEWANETGWGLTVDEMGANEHSYLTVLWGSKQVVDMPTTWAHTGRDGLNKAWKMMPQAKMYDFDRFIEKHATLRVPR